MQDQDARSRRVVQVGPSEFIFGDPLTLFDSELCDEQLHRRPAGDRGRAWPINIEEVTSSV